MTGELLLASVVIGLSSAWLVGVVMGKGQYGLLGDLTLAAHAGTIGAIVAALIGAIGVLLAQRKLRFLVA